MMLIRFKRVTFLVLLALTVMGGFAQVQPTISGRAAVSPDETIVKGVVRDAVDNRGVDGARIRVEGYSASIADASGNFSIKVPDSEAIIIVEADGYNSKLVPVKHRSDLVIYLLTGARESFHDLITTPSGNQYKKVLTHPVQQMVVDGWQQPNEVVDAMLQGNITGLNVIRRSGMQGVGANMFMRGINSIYATNKPLIIVDGMPYDANDYGESLIANTYTNPLNFIDVKDIDNITVLKDAASVYGAKGANGAIIITTVRAKSQATRIDGGIYAGFNFAPESMPVMNAANFRTYLSSMLQSRGMTANQIAALPYMSDDPTNSSYYRFHNDFDWQRRVMKNSMNQNVYLRITGGDNIATYGLTVGYMKNAGVIKNTDLERYNTRFNAEFNFSEKFTGVASLAFTFNNQNLRDQGIADNTVPLYTALVKAPFFHDHELDATGAESPNLEAVDLLGITNPSVLIDEMEAYNKAYRFFGSFGFKYDISKHFNASTLVGIQLDKVRESFFVPGKGVVQDTLWNAVARNRMGAQVKRLFSLFNDTRLEYNRTYNYLHQVGARIGTRFQNNRASQVYVTTANAATDDLISVQNGVASLRQVGGDVGEWSWLNTYLGADYGFRQKLFLGLNLAMDGSSRFGKRAQQGLTIGGYKFPLFPSASAAWLISSESFMAGYSIDLFKLRASYSVAGNDDIGNYNGRYMYVAQNLLGQAGSVRRGIPNPKLQWETVKKWNGGIDLAFWKERATISLDAYLSNTDNMLVYDPIQTGAGFDNVITNDGRLQNNGIDLSFNVRVVNTKTFKWDIGANAATYKNEILAIPGGEMYTEFAGATILTKVGMPANLFYGYKTNGIYETEAAAAADGLTTGRRDGSTVAFRGGDVRFADINADGLIDEKDRTVIGDPNPDYFGGFSNRFIWKNFELNSLFTFSVGNDVYNYLRRQLESQTGIQNQLGSVMNAWRADGQQTSMPRTTWGDPMGNSRFSDRWIEDGSYLRLRSINLTYNWPLKVDAAFKNIALSVTGNNLLTATKYLGYDPEFSVSTSPLAQGIDTGLDPIFRNITVGVRLGL